MTSESAQATAAPSAAVAAAPEATASRKPAQAKPRAGLPVWRTGKPDAVLAAAVDTARTAVESIAEPGQIGAHIGARSEGDRVVTHLFESRLSGYGGWQWFAVLTRNSRSKVITVSELGLLPSEDSILAPEWVPWAERVRPEDERQEPEADGAVEESAPQEDAVTVGPEAVEAEPSDAEEAEAESVETDADEV